MASDTQRQRIWCCGCETEVVARLTSGAETYPHRVDLALNPFWKCDGCGNHVGCHYKTANRTRPLGNIPTPQLRQARQHIHALLDPIWKSGRMARSKVYAILSDKIGRPYHTGEIKSLPDARQVYQAIRGIKTEVATQQQGAGGDER